MITTPSILLAAALASGSVNAGVVRTGSGSVEWTPLIVAPILAAPFRADAPICVASGAALGTRGEVVTFTRAGTKACETLTCQANELCITSSGATLTTGENLSFASPGAGNRYDRWCVCVEGEATGRSWSSASLVLWEIGPTNGGANSTQLLALSTGALDFRVYDANATARQSNTFVHAYADGSTHKLAACDDAGVLNLYSDGVLVATSNSGGTGVITSWPTPVYVGRRPNAGTEWVGALRDLRVVPTANHTACGPGF